MDNRIDLKICGMSIDEIERADKRHQYIKDQYDELKKQSIFDLQIILKHLMKHLRENKFHERSPVKVASTYILNRLDNLKGGS